MANPLAAVLPGREHRDRVHVRTATTLPRERGNEVADGVAAGNSGAVPASALSRPSHVSSGRTSTRRIYRHWRCRTRAGGGPVEKAHTWRFFDTADPLHIVEDQLLFALHPHLSSGAAPSNLGFGNSLACKKRLYLGVVKAGVRKHCSSVLPDRW